MTTSKRILVTGGAGYIGTHTIIELLNNNYTVIAVDNYSNSYAGILDAKPEPIKRVEKITGKSVIFYKADVSNVLSLTEIFNSHKIDCVIHLAAFKYIGESVKDPLTYYLNNISTSLVLFDVMRQCNVKKLIFSSSSNVYGNPKYLPVTEDHPTGQNCTNPYGRSKYFIEEILKDVCKSDRDFRVISLRYFTSSGAHKSRLIGEDPLSLHCNLIPCIAQVAAGKREKINVFGYDYNTKDGTCVRDYTHISEIAAGHVRTLEKIDENSFKGWSVYNLAAGKGRTVLEIIKIFESVSQKTIKYELLERRKGDIEAIYADASKAKNELNWQATEEIESICRDVWNWQVSNPHGYRNE